MILGPYWKEAFTLFDRIVEKINEHINIPVLRLPEESAIAGQRILEEVKEKNGE